MINISDILRSTADLLENSQNKVVQQREQSGREVDPQAISDALFMLGATGISILRELFESLPDLPRRHSNNSSFSASDVEGVVNQLIARLGLVEESELAALRKRLNDLEAKLNNQ